jgi:hypothetical protein
VTPTPTITVPDDAVKRVRQILVDFDPHPNPMSYAQAFGTSLYRISIDPPTHPYPELFRFVLQAFLDLPNVGRSEKTAWEIPLLFRNARCGLALQKFGLRLFIDPRDVEEEGGAALAQELVRQLVRALRQMESDVLEPFAKEQIGRGNVTVVNQAATLRRRHEYFRERAAAPPSSIEESSSKAGDLASALEGTFRSGEEMLNNSIAAVSAFSLLEHELVLLLPFAGFDASKESLVDFIGDRWATKFKRIFDISADPTAKAHYDGLHRLAEDHRNPYAHGGFDKVGGSLYFHEAGFAAFPARLSDARAEPYFHFVDGDEGWKSAWELSDEVDEWMRTGPLRHGVRYMEAGFDARFDQVSIADQQAAAASDESFAEYLQGLGYVLDQAANMDW